MGCEFGQKREWQHDGSLEWHVLQYPLHAGVQRWVRDLNRFYRETPALYRAGLHRRKDSNGWIATMRTPACCRSCAWIARGGTMVLVICNFTPVVRSHYRVGVPRGGAWRECLNSDAADYGGSGQGNRRRGAGG